MSANIPAFLLSSVLFALNTAKLPIGAVHRFKIVS
jgi:hypothetical protein